MPGLTFPLPAMSQLHANSRKTGLRRPETLGIHLREGHALLTKLRGGVGWNPDPAARA
jgi:hypothetical protein